MPTENADTTHLKHAAYRLEPGDCILVHQTDTGWYYEWFTSTLEIIDGRSVTGFAFPHQVRDYAMEQAEMTGIPVVEVEYGPLKEQIDRSEETGYPPSVFPYLDREQEIVCDPATEPVVTIISAHVPELRDRMELPLHIADQLFAQIEQSHLDRYGKQERKDCPVVVFRIDYRTDGKKARYSGRFYPGSGNGGLLLHIERAANRRQFYLKNHPEEKGMEDCTRILDKMIPLFYQQSIKGEGLAMNKILPKPELLYNMTREEAAANPAIGAAAFFASHRETVRCAEIMNARLGSAVHHRAIYQYLTMLNREYGSERVKLVLSRTAQLKGDDPRIQSENRAYADAVPVRNAGAAQENGMTHSYELNVHPTVLNAALTAFRKMEQSRNRAARQWAEKASPAATGKKRHEQAL